MLEQINNFAGFNLAAILFSLIGGGIFMIIFHYILMPILSFILIKPLTSVAFYTWEYFETAFSRKKERNEKNEVSNETEKKEVFESFVDWFSSFFIIKIIFFLYVPFFCIIYYLEAKDKNIDILKFNDALFQDTLIGSIIFFSIITIISIIAKLGQIEFKKTFPTAFIFLFLLGLLAP
tara:strand:- start:83 stop:616 length:534 start_codon:yes stop_codon:yes gene_type:complete